jgi:hypothetical protein
VGDDEQQLVVVLQLAFLRLEAGQLRDAQVGAVVNLIGV